MPGTKTGSALCKARCPPRCASDLCSAELASSSYPGVRGPRRFNLSLSLSLSRLSSSKTQPHFLPQRPARLLARQPGAFLGPSLQEQNRRTLSPGFVINEEAPEKTGGSHRAFCNLVFRSSMASAKKQLQGLVAATITPMTELGEINFPVIGHYVDYLVEEQGVRNVFVNGTTGEGLSLSLAERRLVAEEWVTRGKNKLDQVVIHVGALSLKESQELAQHAAFIGADGIAVMAPFFLKPGNKDALVSFLQEVAAAAPTLPFYYYHIPAMTGVKIRAESLLDGIQEKIPSFQGLKFSDTDLLDFGQCVDQNQQRQFALLFGVDEQLLSALVLGATGAVGSTYNYLGKQNNQMMEAFQRQDFSAAQNYQFGIQRFMNSVVKRGFGVAQTKAVMSLVSGIPMGPPRLPLQRASPDFIQHVEAKLKSLDFLP